MAALRMLAASGTRTLRVRGCIAALCCAWPRCAFDQAITILWIGPHPFAFLSRTRAREQFNYSSTSFNSIPILFDIGTILPLTLSAEVDGAGSTDAARFVHHRLGVAIALRRGRCERPARLALTLPVFVQPA
jgi:hypothetical protein